MQTFFKELLDYSHHFNTKLGGIFVEKPTSEKSIKLFNHIINAHHIWNHRILNKQPTLGVWDMQPIEQCLEQEKLNYELTNYILDKIELQHMVSYTNTKGQSFNNSAKDILFHIVNHSTYHHAQIATEFKLNGLEPLITDYIFYKR